MNARIYQNKNPKSVKVVAFIVIGIIVFTLFLMTMMKRTDAYKVATQNIELNEDIIQETGGITGYGMIVTGNVQYSNSEGQAQFNIKVLGKQKNINVRTYLEKESDGEWQLISLKK